MSKLFADKNLSHEGIHATWLTVFIQFFLQLITTTISTIIGTIITATPAYFVWNYIAPIYLSFIPKLFQHIPYWHMIAIFLVITYIGELIKKLIPTGKK
jgi:hypothetical protein